MILISHRGNINGSKPEMENKPEYIQQALDLGYDVEIDVWLIDGNFFLGHDEPQYQVHGTFLMKKGLWCHAKNIDAFYLMSLDNRIHCFSHDKDEVALTSSVFLPQRLFSHNQTQNLGVPPIKRKIRYVQIYYFEI